MAITSVKFILFVLAVIIIYQLMPNMRWRKVCLLVASYIFYGCYNVAYIGLLLGITLTTYYFGLVIDNLDQNKKLQKWSLGISVVICIGILFFFKYINFTISIIQSVMTATGSETVISPIELIVPIGISFFTFQAVGYLIDVKRKTIAAERNLITYALFISFFPSIVSGPIAREGKMREQYNTLERIKWDNIVSGFIMALWGFFLKLVISDRIAIFVNNVYADYQNISGAIVLLAIILYAFQIYADFCGYSCIVIGVGKMFGIELPQNFNVPYLAKSVREFWRRWHISLSNWLRDYVYFPLGGSRCKVWKHLLNIIIVFLISGIWHGANWTFIIWGLIHGLLQVVEIMIGKIRKKHEKSWVGGVLGTLLTFCLVDVAWIFFRSTDISTATGVLARVFQEFNLTAITDGSMFGMGLNVRHFIVLGIAFLIMAIIDVCKYRKVDLIRWFKARNVIIKDVVVILAVVIIVVFGIWGNQYNAANFIYTQF